REVQNDLLVAHMAIDVEDKLPANVAQKLNVALNDALKKAAKYTNIKTTSGNQSTYPLYTNNSHVNGWHGRGELRLESRDFKAAGDLIAELQSTLQLSNVQFAISHDLREKVENDLIAEAIHIFQSRADAVRSAMGAKSYKTVHFSINQGGYQQPYPMMAMQRGAVMADAVAAPEFAGGDSRLTVNINGTIEAQ
ncbi:MAG: SIMPL domain-containing protein, partial [Gallionella sp.]|nr:SIMPL domain-containing protein [Gallionella sp.]